MGRKTLEDLLHAAFMVQFCTDQDVWKREQGISDMGPCVGVMDWAGEIQRIKEEELMLENPNTKQVGGDHYRQKNAEYQHWDLMIDNIGPGYLVAVATKYLTRYQIAGNPEKDLGKALHYIEKLASLYRPGGKFEHRLPPERTPINFTRFAKDHDLTGDQVHAFHLLLGYTSLSEITLAYQITQALLSNVQGGKR